MITRRAPFERWATCVLALALASVASVVCREDETGGESRPVVADLRIEGNSAVSDEELLAALSTQESGRWPWSRKRPFNRRSFETDLKRIERFYNDRGYPHARVESLDITPDGSKKLRITVTVVEGEPVIVERVAFSGFEPLPASHFEELRDRMPVRVGEPRDRREVDTAREAAIRELRDHGYAHATVDALEGPGSGPGRVTVTLAASPGQIAVFGPVTVVGNQSVGEDVIRRQLRFQPGEPFRQSRIRYTQRRLYGLELFQFVHVTPKELDRQAPVVPLTVTVTEAKHRRAEVGLGYGSEEKLRATLGWRHVNFLGGARIASIDTKWSSLDRGVRLGFTQPYLWQGFSLNASGAQWWTYEPTYNQKTTGGRITARREFERRRTEFSPRIRESLSIAYIGEYQTYTISDEALEDLSFRDELIALGLDPTTGAGEGTLSAIALDFERDATDRPLDRRRGHFARLHLETAGGWLGGTFRYHELMAEGRHYLPLGDRVVWANRGRIGALAADDAASLPFFKRYFLGGSTSLRGWGRYQVGPLSGSGLPIGGQSLIELSSEVRLRATSKLTLVGFVDGGNVWARQWTYRLGDLHYDVGPGLRYDTPVGPVRVDVGVQLNRVPELLVEGQPESRRWRVHFSIGQAF